MQKILLVTTNKKRAEKYKIFFQEHNINLDFDVLDQETPEIQSDNVKAVAEFSARWACQNYNLPVIKEDSSFEIPSLNNFPGVFVKFINQWIKAEGYVNLLLNQKDRRAGWHNVLTYCEPGGEMISFDAYTWGTIALRPSKKQVEESNWEADRIWIPKGFSVPIIELDEIIKKTKVFKRKKLKQFMSWYKTNRL